MNENNAAAPEGPPLSLTSALKSVNIPTTEQESNPTAIKKANEDIIETIVTNDWDYETPDNQELKSNSGVSAQHTEAAASLAAEVEMEKDKEAKTLSSITKLTDSQPSKLASLAAGVATATKEAARAADSALRVVGDFVKPSSRKNKVEPT